MENRKGGSEKIRRDWIKVGPWLKNLWPKQKDTELAKDLLGWEEHGGVFTVIGQLRNSRGPLGHCLLHE